MKLRAIKFNKFKTITGGTLDIEEGVTCLVGINESGKSNILLGLEKCDQDGSLSIDDISRHSEEYLREGAPPPSTEMTLIPETHEVETLKAVFGHEDVSLLRVVKTGSTYRVDYPSINYKNSSLRFKEEEETEEEELEEQPVEEGEDGGDQTEEDVAQEGGDGEDQTEEAEEQEADTGELGEDAIRLEVVNALKELLPRFRFFDSVDFDQYYLPEDGDVSIPELIENPDQHAPVINLLKLAGIKPEELNEHSTPQQKTRRDTRLVHGTKQINEQLIRAFWPINTVNLSLDAEGETLKVRIKENELFLPKERSSGLQWALAFNIFFLASADQELQNTILLIDEPGIFLHINAQRNMLSATFPKIVNNGNQIIYTTHLPYLIDKNCPERIRILEKENEDTKIGNKAWSESEFGSIPEPVRTAIGLDIEEAFLFGDNNLIVEGPVDQIYLRTILEKFDPELLSQITIIPAYGVEKIPKVIALAVLSGKKATGMIDSDVDFEQMEQLKDFLKDKSIEVKDIATLVANRKLKTIEDILPNTLFKQSVCNVYEEVFEKRRRKLIRSEINVKSPRVSELETYFRSKLTSSRHKLLKMDIARDYKEIVKDENLAVREGEWKNAEALSKSIKELVGEGTKEEPQKPAT